MYPIDPIYTANMNDQQRAWFYAEYERARKDEVIGVLLAVFLGAFFALTCSWFGLILKPQMQIGHFQQTNAVGTGATYPLDRSGLARQGAGAGATPGRRSGGRSFPR